MTGREAVPRVPQRGGRNRSKSKQLKKQQTENGGLQGKILLQLRNPAQ